MLAFILSSVAQAAVWLFIIYRVRQRAYNEGFGKGMAAWAKVAREFTVSKSTITSPAQQEAQERQKQEATEDKAKDFLLGNHHKSK